jgi:hypothetical protein
MQLANSRLAAIVAFYRGGFVGSKSMRRSLLMFVGMLSTMPKARAQETSPQASVPPLATNELAQALEGNAAAIYEQGKALAELRDAARDISETNKALTEAVDKTAAAIENQNKAVSGLQSAINDVARTNDEVLGELRQAVIALTEETRRASADLVQALAKVAEANRESTTALNEDVKWLREEVRKIELARRVVFVSYPSAIECGSGSKDCKARAETLCTSMGFQAGLAASYQTAAATTGDKKTPGKPAKFGSIGAVCSD